MLKSEGALGIFSDAGKKVLEAMEQWKIMEDLVWELDHTNNNDERDGLEAKLKEAEHRWDELHEYETFKDKGTEQYRFLRAQDYDDRVTESISRFYACPHCGTYFFSTFWKREFKRWYCHLDWVKWCRDADDQDVERLKLKFGPTPDRWPAVGCKRAYTPYAHGMGMVVEFKFGGQWKSFRADLPPTHVDDMIKRHQVAFNKSLDCLTPEDVYDMIPRTYPKANPVELAGFDAFPGLGRFDLEQYRRDNSPGLDTVGWLKFVVRVAQGDLDNLADIFLEADGHLRDMGITYKPSGKTDATGMPLLKAVREGADTEMKE